MVTLPTSLSAQPFPPFPACPGQYSHKDFWRWMPTVVTFQSRFPTARFNNPVIITWKQHSKWPLEGCCPAMWTQASINGPKTTFIFKFYYDTMHAWLGWLMNALLGTKSDAFVYFYYAIWATKTSKRLRQDFRGLMIFWIIITPCTRILALIMYKGQSYDVFRFVFKIPQGTQLLLLQHSSSNVLLRHRNHNAYYWQPPRHTYLELWRYNIVNMVLNVHRNRNAYYRQPPRHAALELWHYNKLVSK